MDRHEVLPSVHNDELDHDLRLEGIHLDCLFLKSTIHSLDFRALSNRLECITVRGFTPFDHNFLGSRGNKANLLDNLC